MSGYWYLATPYSKWAAGIEDAFRMAAREASILIRAKVPVFAPIAHTHPIAIEGGIDPYAHDIWLPADREFMLAARGLIVLMAEGWRESYGISCEIAEFNAQGKPVIYMEPGKVPDLPN